MKKLLLSLFAVFTASSMFAQTELLTNGGFEEWAEGVPTGWLIATDGANTAGSNISVAQSTDDKHSGTYAVAITNTTASKTGSGQKNGRLASKILNLKKGTYTFTAYLKAADATGAVSRIGYVPITSEGKPGNYVWGKNENDYNGPDTLTNEWLKKTFEFTLEASTKVCLTIMHSKNYIDKTVIADDASLTTTDGGIEEGGEEGGGGEGGSDEIVTVAEALAASAGTTVAVTGNVYALCKTGAVVGDATGFIYYFNKNIADMKWNIGDKGTIKGAVSKYGGFNQFTNTAEVTYIGNEAITYPEAEELDGAALDAWFDAPAIKYVKVKGTLSISGNYYNLNVEGTTKAVGSLVQPNDDVLASDVTNNSKVTVVGFAMYTSGSKYVNIVATSVTIDEAGETKNITNDPETAYTTSEAKAIVDEGLGLEQAVYVKGTVVGENLNIATEFKNANYYITDGTYQLYVYRGRFVENTDFTSENQLKEGDEVIIYGKLQNYERTLEGGEKEYIPEFTQGNYIYSLNGNTDAITNVNANANAKTIYDLAGRRVEKAVKGIYIVNGKKVIK